ncbi:hypothetical protein A1O3_02817 [Capronia epimyces CBS 606.96]|uniref:Uncharacterized protein n=1 Tax=Capronia epimyces CBS 606.96 TaxID=1182542 RepID=W9YJ79_9EURO|nr:uncharacterized protein A1O3_02817 [Capronia epimyces CBS 606.96]EXJ89750.1 hypothetical protein A1O3_02817 [Capronia epimyces CBS 606.96]
MSAPVEARSISSLSTLLSNPPRYPRNPTHQIHESLVLYIVRVPGSKDVFLTPLKPPTKTSISIEAVQSSLYFLHVERPEDEELRMSLEATKIAESRNNENIPIQRKPLPPAPYANYPAAQRPLTPPKSYPHYQPPLTDSPTATQVERHAARGAHLRLNTSEAINPSGIPRKPVVPRHMPPRSFAESSSVRTDRTSGEPLSGLDDEQRKSSLARKPVQPASPAGAYVKSDAGCDGASSIVDIPQRAFPNPSLSGYGATKTVEHLSPHTLRITLIRRDPASGSQWNVGSITYRDSTAQENPLRGFEVDLTSPGYVKFAQLEGSSANGLNRRVAYMFVPNNEGSPTTRKRSNSSELFSSNGTSSRKPRQALSFISPWQGMCSFSNGLDGKSIRCRHTLPTANPSMSAGAADVAELRFNLPWSILRLKDPNKQGKEASAVLPSMPSSRPANASNREQWRRSFQALTHKARMQVSHLESSTDSPRIVHSKRDSTQPPEAGEEDRMNLALGRERAGGGFKGQSAKLGKLIIDDEGLKMCDLVVAASMGVWWQHYSGDRSH